MPVEVARDGPVAIVTLDRPDSLNAWDLDMMRQLAATVAKVEADASVRCVVLTGAGRGFCAGIDLGALDAASKAGKARDYLRDVTQLHHEATLAIVQGSKPYVAAINGAAAGGGLALALACDVRLSVPHAKFVAGYLRVGVAPDGGTTWLLPRVMGFGPARDFLLLNQILDATHAETLGLVSEVVAADRLMARASEVAHELASRPPATVAATKAHLAEALGLQDQLAAERTATIASADTPEFAEGVAAFVERRQPRFGPTKGP